MTERPYGLAEDVIRQLVWNYGSDYPDRTISTTLEMSLQFLRSQGLSEMELAKIMAKNAQEFFGWNDIDFELAK